jgi:hypothetical protein
MVPLSRTWSQVTPPADFDLLFHQAAACWTAASMVKAQFVSQMIERTGEDA